MAIDPNNLDPRLVGLLAHELEVRAPKGCVVNARNSPPPWSMPTTRYRNRSSPPTWCSARLPPFMPDHVMACSQGTLGDLHHRRRRPRANGRHYVSPRDPQGRVRRPPRPRTASTASPAIHLRNTTFMNTPVEVLEMAFPGAGRALRRSIPISGRRRAFVAAAGGARRVWRMLDGADATGTLVHGADDLAAVRPLWRRRRRRGPW